MRPTEQLPESLDVDHLVDEVARYLVAVDAFRHEGCPPRWVSEAGESPTQLAPAADGRRPKEEPCRH